MSPHVRVLLFCVSLFMAPLFWSLGERFGGTIGGVLLSVAVVAVAAVWAERGNHEPPAGPRPA